MSAIQRYVYKVGTVVLGGQQVVNLNYLQNPFNATILVNIVSGDAEYDIELTHDDLDGDPSLLHWVDDGVTEQTTTQIFTINTSVTALRLNLRSITGEVRFSVIQGVGLL
jgi:hypothetical protein